MSRSNSRIGELVSAFESRDFEQTAYLARELLIDEGPKHTQIQRIYLHALCECDDFASVISYSAKDESLKAYHAYGLYKKQQFANALDVAQSCDELPAKLIVAQSLYRLDRSDEAVKAFLDLVDSLEDVEERMQVWTNIVSVESSHTVPYCGEQRPDLVEKVTSFLQNHAQLDPYDLAYTLATWQLLINPSERPKYLDLLKNASEQCKYINTDLPDDDLAAELVPIVTNLDVFQRAFWDGGDVTANSGRETSSSLPAPIRAVANGNHALSSSSSDAMNVFEQEPEEKLTALQKRMWYYNRAVAQLRNSQYGKCRASCKLLRTCLPKTDDRVWWESRIAVLLAHCANDVTILDDFIRQFSKSLPDNVLDHALTYAILHKSNFGGAKDVLLQELPQSIRSMPGVVAAARENGERDDTNFEAAERAMAEQDYKKAAELYEAMVKDDDPAMSARWLRALSHVDPERAIQVWNDLSIEEEEEEDVTSLNGADLEQQELPMQQRRTEASVLKKKSHEAVLRHRARKRDEYLAKKGFDANKKPDPERWLPKHERSNARRRHKKSSKSSQGGFSIKDVYSLDVVARQQQQQQHANGKSTAHLTTAGGRKGGKRR